MSAASKPDSLCKNNKEPKKEILRLTLAETKEYSKKTALAVSESHAAYAAITVNYSPIQHANFNQWNESKRLAEEAKMKLKARQVVHDAKATQSAKRKLLAAQSVYDEAKRRLKEADAKCVASDAENLRRSDEIADKCQAAKEEALQFAINSARTRLAEEAEAMQLTIKRLAAQTASATRRAEEAETRRFEVPTENQIAAHVAASIKHIRPAESKVLVCRFGEKHFELVQIPYQKRIGVCTLCGRQTAPHEHVAHWATLFTNDIARRSYYICNYKSCPALVGDMVCKIRASGVEIVFIG
jgi:hypothetical protein